MLQQQEECSRWEYNRVVLALLRRSNNSAGETITCCCCLLTSVAAVAFCVMAQRRHVLHTALQAYGYTISLAALVEAAKSAPQVSKRRQSYEPIRGIVRGATDRKRGRPKCKNRI